MFCPHWIKYHSCGGRFFGQTEIGWIVICYREDFSAAELNGNKQIVTNLDKSISCTLHIFRSFKSQFHCEYSSIDTHMFVRYFRIAFLKNTTTAKEILNVRWTHQSATCIYWVNLFCNKIITRIFDIRRQIIYIYLGSNSFLAYWSFGICFICRFDFVQYVRHEIKFKFIVAEEKSQESVSC